MGSMTPVARNAALRAQFGADRSTLALPILYFALFNGDPTVTGIEPTAVGGYARVAKDNDATLWNAIAAGETTIDNDGTTGAITWPILTDLWSQTTLDHWAIFDNSTGGNLWYYGPLSAPITITGAGDVPRIPSGALDLTQAA